MCSYSYFNIKLGRIGCFMLKYQKVFNIMKNTEKAFIWITDILEKKGIEYKISGGFAARIYGSNRELADIDIEVADNDILLIKKEVEEYIIYGPKRYLDEDWDLNLMTLNYEGQEIDIAGINAKIFNKEIKQWEDLSSSLDTVEIKEVFGKMIPVESLESLINYKTRLGREVDIEDVKQLNLHKKP